MSSQSLSLREAVFLGTAVVVGSAATAAAVALTTTLALRKYAPSKTQWDARPTASQAVSSHSQDTIKGRSRYSESCRKCIDTADGSACTAGEDQEIRGRIVAPDGEFCTPAKTGTDDLSEGLELIPSQLCKMFDRVHTCPGGGEGNTILPAAMTTCTGCTDLSVEATPQSRKVAAVASQSQCNGACSASGEMATGELQESGETTLPSSGSSLASECWYEKQTCGDRETSELSAMHKTSPVSKTLVDGKRIDPTDPRKRENYLSWDDYFMAIAFLSAKRSKDPNRQVGACIVGQDKVILGIGYNGFPRNISDDDLPWAKVSHDDNPLKTKYPYVCHAEVNAVLNKNGASAPGQRLYVTLFPCNECAKIIIQSGIAEVVYFQDKGCHEGEGTAAPDPIYAASRRLLSLAGVKVWQHRPNRSIIIDYT